MNDTPIYDALITQHRKDVQVFTWRNPIPGYADPEKVVSKFEEYGLTVAQRARKDGKPSKAAQLHAEWMAHNEERQKREADEREHLRDLALNMDDTLTRSQFLEELKRREALS